MKTTISIVAVVAAFGFGFALNSGTDWLWGSLGAGSVSVVGEGEPEAGTLQNQPEVAQQWPPPSQDPRFWYPDYDGSQGSGEVLLPKPYSDWRYHVETAAGGHVSNLADGRPGPTGIVNGDWDGNGIPDWHPNN